MKGFSKYQSFGVDFKLQAPPLKIKAHNINGVRNQVNNPDGRVVMTNYVCMYVCMYVKKKTLDGGPYMYWFG